MKGALVTALERHAKRESLSGSSLQNLSYNFQRNRKAELMPMVCSKP